MASVLVNNALECAICCETLKSPKVLQCGHTYCLDCIERYISGRTETFPCPLCGQSVRIPEGGAKMLTTNFIVQATTSTSSIQEASKTTSPHTGTTSSDATSSDAQQVTGTTSSDTPQATGTTSPDAPQATGTTSSDTPQATGTTSSDTQATGTTSPDAPQVTGTASPDTQQVTGTTSPDTQATGTTSPDTQQVTGTTSSDTQQVTGTSSSDTAQVTGTTSPDTQQVSGTTSSDTQATGTTSPDTQQVTGTTSSDTQVTGTTSSDTQVTGTTESSETTPADVKCKNVKYYCPNHSDREVEYYCTNCNILLCNRCFIKQHNGHEYIDLQCETAKDNATELVLSSEKLIQNKIESLEKTYATLLETSENLKYFGEDACLRITKQTERIIEDIKNTSEKTKADIRNNVHQTEKELTESKEKVMEQITNFKLDLDTNLPSLTEDSCIQILVALPKIKELEELCKTVKDNTPEIYRYMDWKDSDPSVDIAMLGSIVSKSYYKHQLNHFRFNINDINDKGIRYYSRDKYTMTSHDLVWSCWVEKFNKKYLSVKIELKSDDNPTLDHCFIDCEIRLLNNVNKHKPRTGSNERFETDSSKGWGEFISWATLSDKNEVFLSSNDQFAVELEITNIRNISFRSR